MLDLPALPIAVALTLWDAAPIFFSVGPALAVLASAVLPPRPFHTAWHFRDKASIEGIIYLLLFQPSLAPVLGLTSLLSICLNRRLTSESIGTPSSPLRALAARSGELLGPLLLAGVAAAVIKIVAPSVPSSLSVYLLISIATGLIIGRRAGTVAIPAVAIAVHLGGIIPATACIIASTAWPLLSFSGVHQCLPWRSTR